MTLENDLSTAEADKTDFRLRLLCFNVLLGPSIGAFSLIAVMIATDIFSRGWAASPNVQEGLASAVLKMLGVMPIAYVLGVCPAIANAVVMGGVLDKTTNPLVAAPISALVGFVSSALFFLIYMVILRAPYVAGQACYIAALFGLLGALPGAICTALTLRRRPKVPAHSQALL